MLMHGLKEINLSPSVRLAMNMANTEACLSGSERIEPFHILLAILNIVDDHYNQASEAFGLTPEEIKSVGESATLGRSRLKIPDEKITAIRRQLHKILRVNESPLPIRKLTCSNESAYLLQKAARKSHNTGAAEVDLRFLLDEVLNDLPDEIAPLIGSR